MLRKRIPTLLALFFLVVSVLAGVVLMDQNTSFLPRANPGHEPQEIMLSNVTDSRFTVSWVTKEPSEGYLMYGETSTLLSKTAQDERDQLSGEVGEYRTHYVTVTGLLPQQTYFAKVGSKGNQLYGLNDKPLTILTGPKLDALPQADTAYGQVLTPVQTPVEGVLIYLHFESAVDGSVLSALTKRDGTYVIPTSLARSSDLTRFVTYTDSTHFFITARNSPASVTTLETTSEFDQPVEPIILGR